MGNVVFIRRNPNINDFDCSESICHKDTAWSVGFLCAKLTEGLIYVVLFF